MGFKRSIQLPDNRIVNIERRDKLCAPGTVFTFRGFGLPIFRMHKNWHPRKAGRADQFLEGTTADGQAEEEKSGNNNRAKKNYGALVVVAALRPNALEAITERHRKRLRHALKSAPGRRHEQEWRTTSGGFSRFHGTQNDDRSDDSIQYTVKEANITNLIRGINRFWFSSAAYNQGSKKQL